jgi:hypothetical protein
LPQKISLTEEKIIHTNEGFYWPLSFIRPHDSCFPLEYSQIQTLLEIYAVMRGKVIHPWRGIQPLCFFCLAAYGKTIRLNEIFAVSFSRWQQGAED